MESDREEDVAQVPEMTDNIYDRRYGYYRADIYITKKSHTDIPSPTFSSSSATDQISELGSCHTRGRLGGVLSWNAIRWLDVNLASFRPLTGGDLGILMGVVLRKGGACLGSMSTTSGEGISFDER